MKQYYIISVIIALLSGVCLFPGLNAMDDATIWEQATQWPDNAPIYDYVAMLNINGKQKINTIQNPKNAKMLLLEAASAQYSAASINIVNTLMQKIDALDPDKKQVVFNATNAEILIQLINNYNTLFQQSAALNAALPDWVAWFVERGIPVDSSNSHGTNAMMAAIGASRNDVVTVLLTHGAQTTTSFISLTGKTYTPIAYAEALTKRENIVTTLKNPPAVTWRPEINTTQAAWDRWVNSKVSDNDMALPSVDRNRKPIKTKERYAVESLEGGKIGYFKQFIANTDTIVLQKIKTNLEQNQNNVNDYAEKIRYIESILNPKSFSFSRLKTAAGFIAAAVTATALYQWFARTPGSAQTADVLINNTGKTIFVSDAQNKTVIVASKAVYQLPSGGTLSVKTNENLDEPDLIINLDSYAYNRADQYLNISISKSWFSWLFGALRYSVRWTEKLQQ
jgi:hypothetical protein